MTQVDHRRIAIARVRELCGNVSEMSIWRWLKDEELDFPKPIYIGRRRYWKEAEVLAWLENQPKEAAQKNTPPNNRTGCMTSTVNAKIPVRLPQHNEV